MSDVNPRLAARRIRMAPDRIHFLKFILEGYDGMALLSTIDRGVGLMELKYPVQLGADLLSLLRSMREQIGIDPVSLEGDWQ